MLGLPAVLLAQSQERTISGRVVAEADRGPLPGVTVRVKDTQKTTATDENGEFSIEAGETEVLVFSYVGFATRELPVSSIGGGTLQVSLQEDVAALDELVVVGYGTQRKSDLTGSVVSVDVERMNAVPTTNFSEMLRGKAPGVQVSLGNARPGGTSGILIRGRNSLSGGNGPLIVVDGAPVSDISDLNTADIESLEVLKDASAQAIYGARASNGVILITTKRGREGKTTVSYNGYVGMQSLWKNFDVFNGPEFADMRREAYRANQPDGNFPPDEIVFDQVMLEVLESGEYVDWEELVLRDAMMQQHDISIRGGSDRTQVAASIGYFDQDGMVPTTGFQRGTLRLNLDHRISDKLSMGTSTYLSRSQQRQEGRGSSNLLTILTMPPLAEPYDENGDLQLIVTQDEVYTNPLFNLQESAYDQTVNRLLSNVFLDWNIAAGLSYRLNTNINFRNRRYGAYESTRHRFGQSYGGEAELYTNETFEYLIENILTYDKDLDARHHMDVTLMQSVNEIRYESLSAQTRGLGNDLLGYDGISQGATLSSPGRSAYKRGILSYMGRARYSFMDKYLLDLTGRVDGSSVFGANEKYGFFPSAALAWKIDEERFFNARFVDQLKLRASYGVIGNEAIDPYQTLAQTGINAYYFGNGESVVGFLPGAEDFPNPDLRWETANTFNVGLDFGLFTGRVSGSLEYYITRTRNLLVEKAVPSVTGFQRVWDNLGQTENKGFEGLISAQILSGNKFRWSADLNFSANRNRILEIFGEVDEQGDPVNDLGNNWFIGEPIDVYYDYVWDGIWQLDDDIENSHQPDAEPGHPRVQDLNGDGQITAEEDRAVIWQDPKWYGSFSTTISYKGFDLYGELYVSHGGVRRNPNLYDYESGGTLAGRLNALKRDYWTPENPTEAGFRPTIGSMRYRSATAYQEASYIRLRTLTLAYNLPHQTLSRLRLTRARIYTTATNLFTRTDYLSFSPEADPGSYPEPRVYRFGVELSF